MKKKYDLNFVSYDGSVVSDKALSDIAIQTNNLANEEARANELKKIELQLYLATSGAPEGEQKEVAKRINNV